MGFRERTQSKRKAPQRNMKIPLVLLVACVASLQAASFMDSVFDGQCPPECCPTEPPTTNPPTGDPATTDPDVTEPAPTEPAPTEPAPTEPAPTEPAERDATGTEDPTTTADICSTCDQSTCDKGDESGAGSASLSLLALLLPSVFARLL